MGVSGIQMEAGPRSNDTNTTAALMRVCVICHLNNTKSVVACQYFLCVLSVCFQTQAITEARVSQLADGYYQLLQEER